MVVLVQLQSMGHLGHGGVVGEDKAVVGHGGLAAEVEVLADEGELGLQRLLGCGTQNIVSMDPD